MTQFECTECEAMVRLGPGGASTRRMECPVCGEQTTWTRAFEEEGVSF